MVKSFTISSVISCMSLVFVGSVFLSFAFLASPVALADNTISDSVIDKINIDVPVSCSLDGVGMYTHNVEIYNGTYEDDIGTTVLSAFCNDNEGFAIYAAGYTGGTIGGENSNKLVGTTQGIGNIATGTATSAGNPDVSNWAMKLAITQDSGDTTGTNAFVIDSDTEGPFSVYHTVPNNFTKVAHKNSASYMDAVTGGVKLTTTYAVYMAKNQPAGMYSGKVKYTLVHPATNVPNGPHDCNANTICYWPNAGNTVVDTMGDQTSIMNSNNPPDVTTITSNMDVLLWASNFQRPGYGFAGWNTEYDYSGDYYGPTERINVGDISTKGISLYAVWVKSAGYFQTWSGCGSMSIGDVTALTDVRDNNTYAVAKLADGHCWMIENLRLDNSVELSADTTDHPLLPLTNDTTLGTTSNYLSASSNSWCYSNQASCIDQSFINTDNTTNAVANMTAPNTNVYSYGNYYNWYSATAGTGTSSITANNTSVNSSICPAGWVLPRGGDPDNALNSDYYKLGVAITGEAPELNSSNNFYVYLYSGSANNPFWSYPNNFMYAGQYNANTNIINYRGVAMTYYNTSTSRQANGKYTFALGYDYSQDYTTTYPGTVTNHKAGGAVTRCLQDYTGR